MRILADENFPRVAVEALVQAGHDVVWVLLEAPGIPDRDVIAWAVRERRVLLTQDKDFGELAFRSQLPADTGVVLVRLFPPLPSRIVELVNQIFTGDADFRGEFVVVEELRVRRRRLP